MKVEVSLRTPWPEGEREEEGEVEGSVKGGGGDSEYPPGEGDVAMRERPPEGSLKLLAGKRLSLLAMAPDDGADQDVEESGGNDELLECSYTGEPPPM